MGAEAFLSEQVIGLSESIDDRVAALLQAGTGIALTYNDAAGTLTIAASSSFDGSFAALTGKPTTLSGYGITDAQPLDSDLTAIAALSTTSFGRALLTQADAAATRATIGAGTSSFDGTFAALSGKPTTLSGYGITDAQPLDSDLTAIAALTTTSFGRSLLTQADAAATRSTIGAGTGTIGGSTGSTDNAVLRADGAGGVTVQSSAVTIDDSGNISGLGTVGCGAVTATGKILASQNNQTDYLVQATNNTTSGSYPIRNGLLIETTGTGGASSSSQLLRINSYGSTVLAVTPAGTTLNTNLDGVANLTCVRQTITNSAPSIPSLVVRIGASPTANVQEWQDSGSVVRASITSAFGISAVAGTFSGLVTVGTYTVATLPSAAANAGALAQVTDSSVTANGSVVAGGGSNRVVVFSNGSTWDVVVA